MKFSVVINTYNRAASLEITLESLRYLREVDFEVIVVNGPSTDHTCDVLSKYQGSIRVGSCAERNLSISRNVGIAMAQGDIVAFIDDDAVPDEYWLRDLLSGYDAADVGGVGGVVYDYTGYIVQYRYSASDRFGNARSDLLEPLTDFCYPFVPRSAICKALTRRFGAMSCWTWEVSTRSLIIIWTKPTSVCGLSMRGIGCVRFQGASYTIVTCRVSSAQPTGFPRSGVL